MDNTGSHSEQHRLHRHFSHTDWSMQYWIMSLVGLALSKVAFVSGEQMAYAIGLIPFVFGALILLLATVHMIAANLNEQSSQKRLISTIGIVLTIAYFAVSIVPQVVGFFA